MQNLGTLYRDTKEYDKALAIFDDILTIISSSQSEKNEHESEKRIVSPNIEANILNAASGINIYYFLIFY